VWAGQRDRFGHPRGGHNAGVASTSPLFEPGSAIRRIGGESALLFSGGRALLMQVAHPLVAAGVAEHSGFTRDPWRRLARTMQAVYGIVYGTAEDGDRIGRSVRAGHAHVQGVLREDVGRFPAGTPYRADDPELLMWVHATLVDNALEVHERFVGPVAAEDREAFHEDMKAVARLFGVPSWALPATYAAFAAYVDGMLGSDTLAVGADARAIARAMFDPPLPLPLRPTAVAVGQITTAILPDPLPALYGLRAGRPQHALARTSAAISRRLVPRAPSMLRMVGSADERARPGLALRVLDAMAR
jgi:uncharacterized protein (DUF2236 family)